MLIHHHKGDRMLKSDDKLEKKIVGFLGVISAPSSAPPHSSYFLLVS